MVFQRRLLMGRFFGGVLSQNFSIPPRHLDVEKRSFVFKSAPPRLGGDKDLRGFFHSF
jgi:hypothetical protein